MPPPDPPAARFVLLGASNLKMGFPAFLRALRRRAGGPVEVLAALGHGRSYGAWSRILCLRWLPGILDCGLWRELERRQLARRQLARRPPPTYALLTDIGNDIGYGERVETLLGWLDACLARLSGHGAEVVLTRLPRARIDRLTPRQVRLAHRLFFPLRPIDPAQLLDGVRRLDDGLPALAAGHGARLLEPRPAWYGLDPIHIRRRLRSRAWEEIAGRFSLGGAGEPPPRLRPAATRGFPGLRAEEVRLFYALRLHTPQPAYRFRDGSTVSLY